MSSVLLVSWGSSKPFGLMQITQRQYLSRLWSISFFQSCAMHNCYLVIDNASIHNDNHLAQILAQKNITLVKLPPYTYDLSPIEMVFSLDERHILPSDTRILTTRLSAFNDISAVAIQNFNRRSWRIQGVLNDIKNQMQT